METGFEDDDRSPDIERAFAGRTFAAAYASGHALDGAGLRLPRLRTLDPRLLAVLWAHLALAIGQHRGNVRQRLVLRRGRQHRHRCHQADRLISSRSNVTFDRSFSGVNHRRRHHQPTAVPAG
ncbi:hypothetical protein Dimus_017730 [Dionaea muscipula]